MDGVISEILDCEMKEGSDLKCDWLIPGLVDIHSDQLERELRPRPTVEIPLDLGLYHLDVQAICCGVTTVFNCVRFSDERRRRYSLGVDAVEACKTIGGLLEKCNGHHYVQARWDINSRLLEPFIGSIQMLDVIKLVVFNESVPGARQITDLSEVARIDARSLGISEEEAIIGVRERIKERKDTDNRRKVSKRILATKVLGSHDDTTPAQVEESYGFGSTICEMPTTLAAAEKAKSLGMSVCMGAPNFLTGKSAYGNLSCETALRAGVVDQLCSDYYLPSMLGSLAKMISTGISISEAVNLLSLQPARSVGLCDRIGSIEVGKNADLVAFRMRSGTPVISGVWISGRQCFSAIC